MAGRTAGRTVAGRVFSCGVYTAAADRPPGAAQCQKDLQHSLPGGGRDTPHDRGGPPASRRGNRFPGRAAHLGSDSPPPPPYPLRSAGRRNQPRQFALDPLPKVVLPSRQGPQPLLSQEVSDSLAKSLSEGQAPIPRRTGIVGPTGGLRRTTSKVPSRSSAASFARGF